MKKSLILFLVCLSLVGCVKSGKVEYVDVVISHRDLTPETNKAIIASLRDEIQGRTDLTDTEVQATMDLIGRLELIARQSELIYEYVMTEEVDEELISRLIRNRWKRQ